jgi:hypothetical protein
MNRLQSELHRLYSCAEIDATNRVRAMVLEVTGPPDWEVLSKVWKGVQTELDLPAPAIAVSGTDGLQLWFSLDEPIAVPRAHEFLESLRSRFLPDVDSKRLRLMPAANASAARQDLHARILPAEQGQTGNWSAFLAPDLAPVFAETPWLDIPPNEEGQAALLRGLSTMKQPAFEAASKRLTTGMRPQSPETTGAHPAPATAHDDPKRFLLRVMNDDTIALALRIEAAKALLPYSSDHRAL